jgi:RNA polymerase sigma-70 factor, ECF subfamily
VDYAGLSDHALMERLKGGDMAAFEALYDRYCRLVYSIALRALHDLPAAEDVVQEVFFRVWERGRQFDRGRGPFVAWLIGVARNRAIDECRRQRRRLRIEAPSLTEQDFLADGDASDPSLAGVIAEERAAVRAALSRLPVEQRLAIELAYFQGMTQQEIANTLGHPLGTVKTRIRMGMRKVRGALASQEGDN